MKPDMRVRSAPAIADGLLGSMPRQFSWPDTLAIILVAWLGEYAGAVATATPALVGSWISHLGTDNAMAGMLATGGLIGQTIGLVIGVLLVSRWPLARFAWIGLLVAIAFDAISISIDDADRMLLVRLAHGIGAGLIMAAAINWMARRQQSVRAFAVFILLQAVLPRVFLNIVPLLTPFAGHAGVYVGLIAWGLTCALFIRVLSLNSGGVPTSHAVNHSVAPFTKRASAVMAMMLFNFTAVGTWTFLVRYAESSGLSAATALQAIGWSAICSVLGGWLAFVTNTKIDRSVAIGVSYAVLMINALAMGFLLQTSMVFAAEMFLGGFVVSFLLPHMLATQSALDTSGRLPIWGLAAGGVGASLGPIVFGFITQQYSFGTAFVTVAGLYVIGCVALIFAAGRPKSMLAGAALVQA